MGDLNFKSNVRHTGATRRNRGRCGVVDAVIGAA
jgi:hypothetical protein